MHRPGAVLARQKPDAQQRLHVRLDETLYIGLDLSKMRHDLGHAAIRRIRAEQLQARHLPLLGSESINTEGVRDCFRERLRGCEDSVRAFVRPDFGALVPPVTGSPRFPHVSPNTPDDASRRGKSAGQRRRELFRTSVF